MHIIYKKTSRENWKYIYGQTQTAIIFTAIMNVLGEAGNGMIKFG